MMLNASTEMIYSKYGRLYTFHSLVNGYRRFDPSRGMDYKLDIAFHEVKNNQVIQKR